MSSNKKIPNLKTNPKYKEAPRFELIYGYEGEFKKNYSRTNKAMITELSVKMIDFIKNK